MEEISDTTLENGLTNQLRTSSINQYQQLGRITSGKGIIGCSTRNSGGVLKNASAQLNAFTDFKTKAKVLRKNSSFLDKTPQSQNIFKV